MRKSEGWKRKRSVALIFLILCVLGTVLSGWAQNTRRVEIILDASGSMNGLLADGQLKIAAAKAAVAEIAQRLPDDLILAFRAYGHQSPREKKDCEDTQLLVDFAVLKDIRQEIISGVDSLKAQGYTPITYVLGKAALDFPDEEGFENIIVLVSDGKETCKGDPCVTAKNLKEKNVSLTVHTIGFGVDTATKSQLDCISKVTGGTYFDASNTEDLIQALTAAVEAATSIPVESEGQGWLEIEGADLRGHKVINAETGEEVAMISNVNSTVELPAGIYHVTVGRATWKSIEVKNGETTVLKPGWLVVENASFRGHRVLEEESGEEHGSVSILAQSLTLMPGEYLVTFGSLEWPVTIKSGKSTTLNPGVVSVEGASYRGHEIKTEDGKVVGSVSNTASSMPLPPGNYTIAVGEKIVSFTIEEGQRVTIENK